MKLGDRIKELRRQRQLTQDNICDIIECSRQAISRWENNKQIPNTEALTKLASALGVTTDYLIGREEDTKKETFSAEPNISEQRLNIENVIWIPVISPILKCSAGDGNNYENSDVAWDIVSKYPLFDGPLSALYNDECLSGMYAEGDSMEPQIHDGDLVVFVHDNTWIPGNIAIVRLDGKLFVKGILRGKSSYILRSQNKNYADIEVHESDDFSIVGRVVKIITDRNPKPIL